MTQSAFKKCNVFLAALVLFFNSTSVVAQTKEQLDLYKAKYPGQHIVQLKNIHTVRIKLVKDIPVITHIYEQDYLILDKNGLLSLNQESIDFTPFEKVANIEAYSLVPTEKGSKKVPATNFQTADAEASGNIFHDGSKETSFIYPGMVEGTLRHLYYEVTFTDNTFPFGFSFYGSIPCENPTLKIECDTAIHLFAKEFNTEKVAITHSEIIVKGKRISTWSCPNDLLIKSEDFAPSTRYYAPHILAQIGYYHAKDGKKQVTQTITDLHDNYQKNVEEVESETPSPELTKIADSITKGLSSDFEKVRAIYYWVQENIKYIAFEEGIGGYVPRQPSKVITKRYGDCKDMASLIYSMAKSVNVTTYLTWIGSRDLPYKYTEFPSSFCDNHMITTYKENSNYYYLDATNSFQPIDMPTGFIQGKEAFIHLGKDQFEITQVPIPDATVTTNIDSSYIKLQDKNIIGYSKTTSDGYYHILIGNIAKDVPLKEMDKFISNINEKGNNSFSAKNVKVEDLNTRNKPVVMTYDWKVSNYATTLENEIFINMLLYKDFAAQGELKDGRIAPYEMDHKLHDKYIVVLEIPEGYKVKSLPKNSRYHTDFMDYSMEYTQQGNTITMTLHFELDFILLPPARFAEWNEFIKIKKAAAAETVVLIKK
jgi:hypothetical protein